MKVLLFCNLVPRKTGAFERYLELLGATFQRNGDSLVLALGGEPVAPVAAAWRLAGIRWTVLPGWTDAQGREHAWRMTLPAVRLLRRERPDVAAVHFGNELPSLLASLAGRVWGGRRVRWVWEQDQQIAAPSRISARVSRLRALRLSFAHFVAAYEGGRTSMLLRGIPAECVTTIHNSVGAHECAVSREVLRARLGIPAEAVMLMSVGSLIPRKRMDFIVKALGPVLRTAKNAWVLVAGDGPESSALESLARREVSDGRIRFLGLRDDVRDLLAAADVCVHASVAEACTYAVTESMSAGIPAVVTEAGAHREQIEDGCSGYVLGCDDSAGFAARVAELVNDPARRRSMGERALERWRQHFQVEAQAAAYHALYRRVSAGGEKIETSRG